MRISRIRFSLFTLLLGITLLAGGFAIMAALWPSELPAEPQPRQFEDAHYLTRAREKPRYTYRKRHDPNGIGKFYMGREIARVMGYEAADWLQRPEREEEENLSLLLESLDLEPGMVVADIGAGSGVLSIPIAEKVTPMGKVIAVDVQQEMLDLLAEKLKRQKVTNVELMKGTPKSPRLKPNSVELALMVDVYHEFEFPYEMMLEISQAVRPGGRVILVEYRKEDPTVLIKLVHKMTEDQVKKELLLSEFELEWEETIDVLPRQHIIVFERQPPSPTHQNNRGDAEGVEKETADGRR